MLLFQPSTLLLPSKGPFSLLRQAPKIDEDRRTSSLISAFIQKQSCSFPIQYLFWPSLIVSYSLIRLYLQFYPTFRLEFIDLHVLMGQSNTTAHLILLVTLGHFHRQLLMLLNCLLYSLYLSFISAYFELFSFQLVAQLPKGHHYQVPFYQLQIFWLHQ